MTYRLIKSKTNYDFDDRKYSCEHCGDSHFGYEYCDTCGMPPCRCFC